MRRPAGESALRRSGVGAAKEKERRPQGERERMSLPLWEETPGRGEPERRTQAACPPSPDGGRGRGE